jgi:hypothetical protein
MIHQQQQQQEPKPKQQQQQTYSSTQLPERPLFDLEDANNIIAPSVEPYELHRTPKKESTIKMSSFHHQHKSPFHHDIAGPGAAERYAASSVAAAEQDDAACSSVVTSTDVCDSESYLAIQHEMTLNCSSTNRNNISSNHNNSTRETISLNDSNEQQQQQQQQNQAHHQQDTAATTTIPMTDATQVVHEMHLALLYLLSNPEEFQRALAICQSNSALGSNDDSRSQQAKTLQEWNNEYHSTTSQSHSRTINSSSSQNHHHNHDNIDNESLLTEHTAWQQQQQQSSSTKSKNDSAEAAAAEEEQDTGGTPLPFVVFADDAEVVLPQAHTASQLFGLERIAGIELEAAAGLPALSQLFLRWLAIMPAGDHLNLIDPPGLTVMRIAGGRYRVTAAHRVVWTWMNEFVPLEQELHLQQKEEQRRRQSASFSPSAKNKPTTTTADATSKITSPSPSPSPPPSTLGGEPIHQLQVGDLVTMTIVDVFETDNQGKLLSYCPTFDNRAVYKTHATTEALRKSTTQALHLLGQARQSKLAHMVMRQAKRVAASLRLRVNQAVSTYSTNNNSTKPKENSQHQHRGSPSSSQPPTHAVDLNLDDDDYDNYNDDQEDDTSKALMEFRAAVAAEENGGVLSAAYAASSTYLADDDLERHEV